jgi:60 kDa SS-A/Ro ribonucleoprotein
MTTNYAKHVSTKQTPQSEPIPGSSQVQNSAGGYAWAVDDWTRLDRFLILGTEGGTYYASEPKLTRQAAAAVERALAVDGARVVDRVVEISKAGRAPKNDPAIFVLAMAAKLGNDATRAKALEAVSSVCRIGTHIMQFAEYVQAFGGWGRGTRTAIGDWYNAREPRDLAHQLVKYQQRNGWANRDLLRLSHPVPRTPQHQELFRWASRGWPSVGPDPHPDEALRLVWALERAKEADERTTIKLIADCGLMREGVATHHLNSAAVWEALLVRMKPEAMVRNLGKMTSVGLLAPLSEAVGTVSNRLGDAEVLRAARLHPIKVLSAMLTYASGHGARGGNAWTPVQQVVDALDGAFYRTFACVAPAMRRVVLALDVSGSMDSGTVAGVPGLTPRIAAAAMALVTAATEPQHALVGFSNRLVPVPISPRMRLDTAAKVMRDIPMGGTDCALPMVWALGNKVEADAFIVYTDNETWHGNIHPAQALRQYRQQTGIGAKLVVVGMTAAGFSIADPEDAGMMDVVGFDAAAPAVIADFCR